MWFFDEHGIVQADAVVVPPPTRTAYFCARRRPEWSLRVSTMRARCPPPRPHKCASCGHGREQLQKVQCGALSAQQRGHCLAAPAPPDRGATLALLHMPGDLHGGSSAAGRLRPRAPQITASSRARMRARARRAGSIRPAAVRSPVPTSSAGARATSAWARAVTSLSFMGRVAGCNTAVMAREHSRNAKPMARPPPRTAGCGPFASKCGQHRAPALTKAHARSARLSHQPRITTASPSSRNTRCSPPGNCTGFLLPVGLNQCPRLDRAWGPTGAAASSRPAAGCSR